MWGNGLGWVIGLGLALVINVAVITLDRRSRPTGPDAFGLDPRSVAPLELPLPDALRLPADAPAGESAAGLYRDAIARVSRDAARFDRFASAGAPDDLPAIEPALALLRRAAGAPGGPIFAATPAEVVGYQNVSPPLQALDLLGRSAVRAALLRRDTDPGAALDDLHATLILGHRLFEERLTYAQLDTGLRHMAESAAAMKWLLRARGAAWPVSSGSPARDPAAMLAALEAFDAARLELARTRVLPVVARIRSTDADVIGANAGNVRRWAVDPGADRVWRVESILALGRARFFVGRGTAGDQRAANRVLHAIGPGNRPDGSTPPPDPAAQAAASAARTLTLETYRMLR